MSFRSFLILYLLVALFILAIFVRAPGINGYEKAMVGDMIYGKAHKPFVSRTLLPTTTRIISSLIPRKTRDQLVESVSENRLLKGLFLGMGWEIKYFTEYVIVLFLMYLSLLGFVFSLRYFISGVYQTTDSVINTIPLFALFVLPGFFKYYGYLYDLPNIFLFTLGFALMVRRKWVPYFILFSFACINKETAFFLTFVFVIHYFNKKRIEKKEFYTLFVLQAATWIIIKAILTVVFKNNPGGLLEFHWNHNLKLIWPYDFAASFLWIGVILLLFYRWAEKPVFLKNGMWLFIPLFILGFLAGYMDELRIYYEIYPVFLLLITHSVCRLMKLSISNVPENGTSK